LGHVTKPDWAVLVFRQWSRLLRCARRQRRLHRTQREFSEIERPTGTVFNAGEGFRVTANGHSAAAQFLFATEEGSIYAWTPVVDAVAAIRVVDRSALDAVYTGLALGTDASGHSFLTPPIP